uniref:SexM n=1 Tax=Parasitella parasitica TaxID=35722 RepID=A0A3G1J4X9_9FUNG|nr:SexM [Parasitella parasitica]
MKIVITTAEDIISESQKAGASREKIKRPSNSFLCFRTYFNSKFRDVMKQQEKQCDISRMARDAWKLMSEYEKRQWSRVAEEKSIQHKQLHPLYKFNPITKKKRLQRSKSNKLGSQVMNSYTDIDQASSSSSDEIPASHPQIDVTDCMNKIASPVEPFDYIVKELSNPTLPSSSLDESHLIIDGASIDFRTIIDLWINDEK